MKELSPSLITTLKKTPGAELSRDLMRIPYFSAMRPDEGQLSYRFLQITEISEEKPGTYQRAMENVIAIMQGKVNTHLIYLLRGSRERVSLHLGVAVPRGAAVDIHEARKNLRSAMLGHLPGVCLDDKPIDESLEKYRHFGVAMGVPTANEDDAKGDEDDFQGIERLIRAMQGDGNDWQLVLVARPMGRDEIQQLIHEAMALASEAATWSKATRQVSTSLGTQTNTSVNHSDSTGDNESTSDQEGSSEGATEGKSSGSTENSSYSSTNKGTSIGTNTGKTKSVSITTGTSTTHSTGLTQSKGENMGQTDGVNLEIHDKWNQALLTHLEESLLPRLRKGMNKGLFNSVCYLAASDRSTFNLLSAEVKSTFQGDIETTMPMEVYPLEDSPKALAALLNSPNTSTQLAKHKALVHSLRITQAKGASMLGSVLGVDEISIMASLPRKEVAGIVRRKNVDFALSLPAVPDERALTLGRLVDHGRELEQGIRLDKHELDKHVFIAGVTGAGKTTTCMKLLLESGLPFLVIEPAKTEYRALLKHEEGADIDCYRLGNDPNNTLRINPFQLMHRSQRLGAQVSLIQATLSAVFPLEASMPQLVEMAIIRAYEAYGWDIDRNENDLEDDPWHPAARVWPNFSDMIAQLDLIIPEQKMGKEFEDKYRGSLVSRLSGLTRGVLGPTLDAPYSTDFNDLIDRRVIIELEGLSSPEHKALLMGLILGRLAEAMKHRHRQQPGHRHLTLIEEAHRLLARPEPGESANRKNAVETFANLLSEIRKYGEGLIIADQIPNKLVSDVIKNTHVKIIHRLYAEDDRRTVGEAMMLSDEQRAFLPNLLAGEAIVYRGGWHGAARVRIKQGVRTDDTPVDEDRLLQQGVELFWRQRHALYPHLSETWTAGDSRAFADFVRQARAAINLLFKMASKLNEEKKDRALDAHANRLLGILRAWQDGDNDAELTAMFEALLKDSRPRLRSDQKSDGGWSDSHAQVMREWFCHIVTLSRSMQDSPMAILEKAFENHSCRKFITFMARFESI